MTDKKHDSIHYLHTEVVYVPCYFSMDAGYPGFKYNLADATHDEQIAASMEPDYILVLKGTFDAKTQPYDEEILKYNQGFRSEKESNNPEKDVDLHPGRCCEGGYFSEKHDCRKQEQK